MDVGTNKTSQPLTITIIYPSGICCYKDSINGCSRKQDILGLAKLKLCMAYGQDLRLRDDRKSRHSGETETCHQAEKTPQVGKAKAGHMETIYQLDFMNLKNSVEFWGAQPSYATKPRKERSGENAVRSAIPD